MSNCCKGEGVVLIIQTFLSSGNKYRYLVIISLLIFCISLALYVNLGLHLSAVYPHFFYLPVILTGVWFYKKAVWTAVLLGSTHLVLIWVNMKPADLTEELISALIRFGVLIIIAWLVAVYAKQNLKNNQTAQTNPDSLIQETVPAIPAIPSITARWFDSTKVPTAPVKLQIQTFGPLKIMLDGAKPAVVNWRTTKTRDLLAYLLHIQEAVDRETILEDIWPGFEREKVIILFHTTLHNLRQALNQINCHDCLIYQNKRYQLHLENLTLDRKLFEEIIIRSMNKELAPEGVAFLLEEAVALYKGDYLAELDYDWIRPEQERLKQIYGETRQRLADYYLKKREFSNTIHHLQILTGLNPLNEEIHCLLMTSYAGLGDWLAVERQYQTLTTLLKNELGLAPSAKTRNTFYQLFQR
jgi:two-component SAPR family response regulator